MDSTSYVGAAAAGRTPSTALTDWIDSASGCTRRASSSADDPATASSSLRCHERVMAPGAAASTIVPSASQWRGLPAEDGEPTSHTLSTSVDSSARRNGWSPTMSTMIRSPIAVTTPFTRSPLVSTTTSSERAPPEPSLPSADAPVPLATAVGVRWIARTHSNGNAITPRDACRHSSISSGTSTRTSSSSMDRSSDVANAPGNRSPVHNTTSDHGSSMTPSARIATTRPSETISSVAVVVAATVAATVAANTSEPATYVRRTRGEGGLDRSGRGVFIAGRWGDIASASA